MFPRSIRGVSKAIILHMVLAVVQHAKPSHASDGIETMTMGNKTNTRHNAVTNKTCSLPQKQSQSLILYFMFSHTSILPITPHAFLFLCAVAFLPFLFFSFSIFPLVYHETNYARNATSSKLTWQAKRFVHVISRRLFSWFLCHGSFCAKRNGKFNWIKTVFSLTCHVVQKKYSLFTFTNQLLALVAERGSSVALAMSRVWCVCVCFVACLHAVELLDSIACLPASTTNQPPLV